MLFFNVNTLLIQTKKTSEYRHLVLNTQLVPNNPLGKDNQCKSNNVNSVECLVSIRNNADNVKPAFAIKQLT